MELMIPHLSVSFPPVDGDPGFSLYVPPLALQAGKLTFIMGHNGSGKSLFLKLLSGELASDQRINLVQNGKKAGFVRQQAELSLAGELTVRENLLLRLDKFWLPAYLLPNRFLGSRTVEVLRQHSELLRKLDQPCRNLSVGQRQTLAIIAVTVRNSPLLLLDEFLAATDHDTSKMLIELVREYALRTPACVLIVSHDIGFALREGERILLFNHGQLVRDLMPGTADWDVTRLANLLSYSAPPNAAVPALAEAE